MDRSNTRLTIKIAGKNMQGEPFQDTAALESFGNFGAIIYTSQQVNLSDLLHICGGDGEPLATAEVVWVRTGDMPALEVLLHRSIEPLPVVTPPAPVATTTSAPPVAAATNAAGNNAVATPPPLSSFSSASSISSNNDSSKEVTRSDTPGSEEM